MVGAASAASFYAPISKVKRWTWESTWAVAGIFSWVLLPICVSAILLPDMRAFYGALAEFYPAVTSKEGANFGLTLMALTHSSALPAMGLSAPPEQQSEREQTSEAATHLIYGVVAERVRRIVRNILD